MCLCLLHYYPDILQAVRKAIIAGSFANACHLEVFSLFNQCGVIYYITKQIGWSLIYLTSSESLVYFSIPTNI